MTGFAWNTTPSPQPSLQRGEGVWPCGNWSAMAACSDGRAMPLDRARRMAEVLSSKTQAGAAGRLTTGFAWNTASSPQPSPQWGEGVWPCGIWGAMAARSDVYAMQLQQRNQSAPCSDDDARPASIRRATDNQTTSSLRLTPSSPRPSGERARVRGNQLKATQEPQQ